MPPNSDKQLFKSSLNFKYPTYRKLNWGSADGWLDGKKIDDDTDGLWRVHDGLYDLTDFVDKHPGGKMWLELCKGTDVTEAFEIHHFSTKPEEILKKHFVRNARNPRNSPLTFKDDGFYRTLKKRVQPILKDVSKNVNASNYIIDSLLIGTFIFGILANIFWSYALAVVSGILLCWTTTAAHNYLHRRDNFRMYYFNFSTLHFREFRITHALSHHLFPNTIIDYEISYVEPLVEYLPKQKLFIVKYFSWTYVVFIWIGVFYQAFINRFAQYIFYGNTKNFHWSDLIPFILPLVMYLTGGQSLTSTLVMWLLVVATASFCFNYIAFNAGHHTPDSFHDGDTPRPGKGVDFGIFQIDTLCERWDIRSSSFLVLTNFGEHALHHLFPTLDHGVLTYFIPIFNKTLEEFKIELKMRSQLETTKGQFQQLFKDKPNAVSPK